MSDEVPLDSAHVIKDPTLPADVGQRACWDLIDTDTLTKKLDKNLKLFR